jgi:DNA modification methylase
VFWRKRRAARKGREKAPGSRARTAGGDPMIVRGDARRIPLRDQTVQCVVTSPPYFQLRDYQCGPRQLGLETTPEQYVAALVEVFREVRRVLRDDGVLWLVLGDSFNGAGRKGHGSRIGCKQGTSRASASGADLVRPNTPNLKPKDLLGIPWRVALALQADGWHLRADVIWSKPNPMPEPVRDRPTRSHEYVFLLSKRRRYFYDAGAIAELAISDHPSGNHFVRPHRLTWGNRGNSTFWNEVGGKRNRRDVWQLPSEPTAEAHYATFPAELAKLCILAGSRLGDLVFDPFLGSGTTGEAAERLGRHWAGIELSVEYAAIAHRRTAQAGLRFKPSGREAAVYPARVAGGAVFGLGGSPEGRSFWGKPGLGGFEPARGGAPIEAALGVKGLINS